MLVSNRMNESLFEIATGDMKTKEERLTIDI